MTVRRPIIRAATVVGVALASMVLGTGAHADTPPFSDPNATGTIGFCDQAGNPITSGSTADKPFASTAVSSVPAPVGYTVANRGKASLFAYQPRQNTDPGEWTGSQMTAGSVFSSDAHPMAAATTLDPSMAEILSAFPAYWDGYFQLRMFYGAPQKQQLTSTYPAAVIKISGGSWTLVSGGDAACGAGKAVSTEKVFLPASTFAPKPAASSSAGGAPGNGSSSSAAAPGGPSSASGHPSSSADGASASAGGTGSSAHVAGDGVSSGGSAADPSRGPSDSADSTKRAVKATDKSTRSNSAMPALVIGSVAVLVAIGGAVFWWARRRA